MLYQWSWTIQRCLCSSARRTFHSWFNRLWLLIRSKPPVSTICPRLPRKYFFNERKVFIFTIVVLRRISFLSFIGLVSIIVISLLVSQLVWILLVIILLEISCRPFSAVKLLNWVNFIKVLIFLVRRPRMPMSINFSIEVEVWLLVF